MVSFIRKFCPRVSEKRRLLWTFGSHVRRVLCFELGTLFPYCFILPWNRPSCERLKGVLTTSQRGIEGNMTVADDQCAVSVHSEVPEASICADFAVGKVHLFDDKSR